jgi:hypothetical protein
MKSSFANWKTTAAGIASIMTGLSGFLHLINPMCRGQTCA